MKEETVWLGGMSYEELRRVVDALYRVHRFLAVITDLDTLLERVMEESKAVATAEACSLLLYDEKRNDLYFHVALGERGNQQALKQQIRLKLGQGIGGLAAEDGSPSTSRTCIPPILGTARRMSSLNSARGLFLRCLWRIGVRS